ncbi:MAG TPA: ANTAR domain-containing protein [Crenalkalicoccus sp.]|nr:ANTAR domain-containing protein [Crenalkalicoccus sp.]
MVVITARDASGEALIRELQRTRNRVRHLWPAPGTLPDDTDVLFCELAPGLPARLPWLPGEPKAALVLLVPPALPLDFDLLAKCAPHAVLHRPYTTPAIQASLALARAQFAYERRLRGRIERLEATVRSMRTVERAKAILMGTRKMAEEEAYRFLRSQAMERRASVGAVAAAIVDAHELLG